MGDFGCSRLDRRIENGRNWALAEGGAGHLGKWAPEMILRLPITDRCDVWGLAITTLEVYSGRFLWCGEPDTVEVVLAQILGLINAKDGLPEDLMRRSPLDITKLYSPWPQHFPLRRVGEGHGCVLEELRPCTWGLGRILGDEAGFSQTMKEFVSYVKASLKADHEERPSAAELLECAFVAGPADAKHK